MVYVPGVSPPISTLEELRQYVVEELKKIADESAETTALELRPIFVAPVRPREGMIVFADGTSWNPGMGVGSYEYQGGSWYKLSGNGGSVVGGNALLPAVASNNVAITPSVQEHGTTASAASQAIVRWNAAASPARLVLGASRGGAIGTHTVVQNADNLGEVVWMGSDGTNFAPAASISCFVQGTPGNDDMPGRLVLGTTSDGAATVTNRAFIDSTGVLPASDGLISLGSAALRFKYLALVPTAFASLPTGAEGMLAEVTDSNTATWGATIAGGGANNVLAFYNGTNWTVAGA